MSSLARLSALSSQTDSSTLPVQTPHSLTVDCGVRGSGQSAWPFSELQARRRRRHLAIFLKQKNEWTCLGHPSLSIFFWNASSCGFFTLVPLTSSCKAHCRCKVGHTVANASRSTHPGGWVGQQTPELGSDRKPLTHAPRRPSVPPSLLMGDIPSSLHEMLLSLQ